MSPSVICTWKTMAFKSKHLAETTAQAQTETGILYAVQTLACWKGARSLEGKQGNVLLILLDNFCPPLLFILQLPASPAPLKIETSDTLFNLCWGPAGRRAVGEGRGINPLSAVCQSASSKPCWELHPSLPLASSFTTPYLVFFSCSNFVLASGLRCHSPTGLRHSLTLAGCAAVRGMELWQPPWKAGAFLCHMGTEAQNGERVFQCGWSGALLAFQWDCYCLLAVNRAMCY